MVGGDMPVRKDGKKRHILGRKLRKQPVPWEETWWSRVRETRALKGFNPPAGT